MDDSSSRLQILFSSFRTKEIFRRAALPLDVPISRIYRKLWDTRRLVMIILSCNCVSPITVCAIAVGFSFVKSNSCKHDEKWLRARSLHCNSWISTNYWCFDYSVSDSITNTTVFRDYWCCYSRFLFSLTTHVWNSDKKLTNELNLDMRMRSMFYVFCFRVRTK